jgi:ubiquinone/menaquinone biosynthesis C-methylase UbiE
VDPKALYKEAAPLLTRVALQRSFGARDLVAWLAQRMALEPEHTLLDLGCGAGHQLIELAALCREGVGLDCSTELLAAARRGAADRGRRNVRFELAEAESFAFERRFDRILCGFALYYMDAPRVLERMALHLQPAGAAFVLGAPDANAPELLVLHRQVSACVPEPYRPGYSDVLRFRPLMRRWFRRVRVDRFVNPITFPSAADFVRYYTATTLYACCAPGEPELESRIAAAAERWLARHGWIRITKVVDAIELREPRAAPAPAATEPAPGEP